MLEEVNLLQDITLATRAMVGAFVDDRTDDEGRISSDSFAGLARRIGFRAQPWEEAIKAGPCAQCLCWSLYGMQARDARACMPCACAHRDLGFQPDTVCSL